MRITGKALEKLRPVLTKALDEGSEVSFQYHNKLRCGPLIDFGWGPQGPFITIEHKRYALGYEQTRTGGYQTEIKSFSLVKMTELRVEQFVTAAAE
tara:strand:- start:296 stop:583 length:288 start_codon:yes stop_codon:yes gene_type:complete